MSTIRVLTLALLLPFAVTIYPTGSRRGGEPNAAALQRLLAQKPPEKLRRRALKPAAAVPLVPAMA